MISLMAAFESPSEMVLVTEYLSGGELFERVAADDYELTEADAVGFVRQVCKGAQYMHSKVILALEGGKVISGS